MNSWKKLRTGISIGIVVLILCGVAIVFVPIRDTVFGVPFVSIIKPMLLGNGFYAQFEVPCNRFYLREIGFRLEPPIPIKSLSEAQSVISGEVELIVRQSGKEINEFVDLSLSGWSLSEGGVWSKVIWRYDPIGTFFCNTQMITIDAQNVNFDLQKHGVTVYVSRDRRP